MQAVAMTIDPSRNTLGALLRLPYEQLADWLYGRLADEFPGVRLAHSAVLRNIAADGSRVVELAAAAGMTKQSMAYLVEQLHALDYLLIEADPDDGRAKRVRLTASGEALYSRALELSAQAEAQLELWLGEADARELRRVLERLSREWRALV
jgi:DNA-binding MarR family transcriptional regulator